MDQSDVTDTSQVDGGAGKWLVEAPRSLSEDV